MDNPLFYIFFGSEIHHSKKIKEITANGFERSNNSTAAAAVHALQLECGAGLECPRPHDMLRWQY